jgi:uncharacterized protein
MDLGPLKRFYAAVNRNDAAALAADFDPDILRVEPGGFDTAGTFRGPESVRDQVVRGRSQWAEGSCDPEDFLVNGDRVVVHLHARVRMTGAAGWTGGRFADGFILRQGRIVEYHTFWDRADAAAWARLQG